MKKARARRACRVDGAIGLESEHDRQHGRERGNERSDYHSMLRAMQY